MERVDAMNRFTLLDHFEAIWRQRIAQLDDVLLSKGK
jgi:hypothetical protein